MSGGRVPSEGEDLLLVAGAGTGKTTALVEAVLARLEKEGAAGMGAWKAVGGLLVVTFTRAAAAELQSRVEKGCRLRAEGAREGSNRFWRGVLEALPSARIGTIHGECARLLREDPERASPLGVPPGFEILEEGATRQLVLEGYRRTLERLQQEQGAGWSGYLTLTSLYGSGNVREMTLDLIERGPRTDPGALREEARRLRSGEPPLDAGEAERLEAFALLAEEVEAGFRALKRDRRAVDFDDLETVALRLATDDEAGPRLRERVQHLFVDEFQDTSLRQMELLLALRGPPEEPGRSLFAVGDPHQSIYGFRGAQGTLAALARRLPGLRRRALSETHRFGGPLLAVVNAGFPAVFAQAPDPFLAMSAPIGGRTTQVEFHLERPRERDPPATGGNPPADPAQPRVLLEDSPSVTGEARHVAQWIAERLGEGERVHPWRADDGPDPHPLGPGDVAVLLSARTHQASFLRELRRRGIPAVPAQGRRFHQQQEVLDLLALLRVLLDPGDPIALYGLLRSPWGGFSDEELAGWALASPPPPGVAEAFERAARSEPGGRAAAFWEFLGRLRALSREEVPARLLRRALDERGVWASLVDDDRGGQALANVEKLLDRVRELFREGATDLGTVLRELERWSSAAPEEEEAVVELARDAVNVLTVHGAKGLEFPLVVLPELSRRWMASLDRLVVSPTSGRVALRLPAELAESPRRAARGPPNPRLEALRADLDEQEDSEARRLFYVGMTRAMHRLLVTGVADPEGPAPPNLRRWERTFRDFRAEARNSPSFSESVYAPGTWESGSADPPEGNAGAREGPSRAPAATDPPPARWAGESPWRPPEPVWTVSELEELRRADRPRSENSAPAETGRVSGRDAVAAQASASLLGQLFHDFVRREAQGYGGGAARTGSSTPAHPPVLDEWLQRVRSREALLRGPAQREVDLTLITPHGTVQGRLDAFFPQEDPPLVLDYKTGDFPASAEEAWERFGFQLSCYAQAFPAPVRVGVLHPPDGAEHFWSIGLKEQQSFRESLERLLAHLARVSRILRPPPTNPREP
jgi:ATP-dependent exoDNAse (exonuclease V) beta subunit